MAYGKFSWENENDDILTKLKKIIELQSPEAYPHNRVIDLPDCKALVAEIEGLQAEVARLKQYTNQKLFAAASGVLEAWDDYNQVDTSGLIEALEESYIPRLIEAVAWWDNLPFDPDKDTERLPKYEMGPES